MIAIFCHNYQGWHIGIGRYEISANIAHIGKTDISVSVIIPADTYQPICNIKSVFVDLDLKPLDLDLTIERIGFGFELFCVIPMHGYLLKLGYRAILSADISVMTN